MNNRKPFVWSIMIGLAVALGHALYLRHVAVSAMSGWADDGAASAGLGGFGSYLHAQDYYLSFSYALGAAFAVWAIWQFLRQRNTASAVGAAGSVTFVGILMGAGCFLIGCCGSPMLAVYAGLFGAKVLGVGKPLMALITLVSVGLGYWTLSRRLARNMVCRGNCCIPLASEVEKGITHKEECR